MMSEPIAPELSTRIETAVRVGLQSERMPPKPLRHHVEAPARRSIDMAATIRRAKPTRPVHGRPVRPTMSRRPRRNHSPALKAKVALASVRGQQRTTLGRRPALYDHCSSTDPHRITLEQRL